MGIRELVLRLGAKDKVDQNAARDALIAAGRAAVGPLVAELRDEGSPLNWSSPAWVLRQIGDTALAPLVETIASGASGEVRRRAKWALSGLKVSGPQALAPAFTHPHPEVRSTAAYVVQNLKADGLPYAQLLLELLGDEDEDVRQRAVWAFGAMGEGAVPVLRAVRRAPCTNRRQRVAALTALAEAGGSRALDERDSAAVARLIAVKQIGEVPAPMHLCGFWYAVPSPDTAAVLDAFGLSDAVPVTMRMGESAWNHDHHALTSNTSHVQHARAYVSPMLDGWTLVFGDHSDDARAACSAGRRDDIDQVTVAARCADLSGRFGAARWYGMSCGDGWTAWCIAERGSVVRYYDIEDAELNLIGTGHPAEEGYLLPHQDGFPPDAFEGVSPSDNAAFRERYDQVKQRLGIPDTCDAAVIAGRTSVDPSALGPHTRVEGSGWLALTACGRTHGTPPGALRI